MMENNLPESESVCGRHSFEHLSDVVEMFERSLSLIEIIAISAQKKVNHTHHIRGINQMSKKIHSFAQKYQEQSERGCIPLTTCSRFVDSLLQIITIYKTKYKNCLFTISIRHFIGFLRDLQSQIAKCYKQQLFSKIINAVNTIIINFCCKQKDQKFKHDQQKIYHSQKIKTLNNEQNNFQKIYVTRQKYRSNNKLQQKQNSIDKKNKISNICHSNMQTKFNLMDGLELDFCHFKTCFVLVEANLDQFQKCCIQRNLFISKIITKYYDSFAKRRDQKEVKRNKPKELTNTVSFNVTVKGQRECIKESIRIHKNRLQTCQMNVFNDKISSLSKDSIAGRQSHIHTLEQSKMSYKLKNVFIVLDKKRDNSRILVKHDLIGSNLNKRKAALQTASINQSYYNGLDYSIVNQIDYLHSKVKIPHNGKINSGFNIIQTSQKDLKMGKLYKDQKMKIMDDSVNETKIIGYVNSTALLKNSRPDNGYKHHKQTKSNLIFDSINRNLGLSLDNTSKAVSEQNRLIVRCNR